MQITVYYRKHQQNIKAQRQTIIMLYLQNATNCDIVESRIGETLHIYLGVDVEDVGTLKCFVLRLWIVEQKPFLHYEKPEDIS